MKKEQTKRTTGEVLPDGTVIEMIYDPISAQAAFAILENGEVKKAKKYIGNGITYVPLTPSNTMVTEKLVQFPSRPEPYTTLETLIDEIQSFLVRYLKTSEDFLIVSSYYIVLSWVYDKFNQLPYLRKIGDYGSGKTRFLDVVGTLCFRPVLLSGSSSVAALFHVLDTVRGTLVLDEADFSRTDEKSELTKILNNGFSKGYPVYRCRLNSNKEYDPKAYQVYGPKLIAARGSFEDDALESRFISERENFTKTDTKNIPISLPKEFSVEALKIRNKLLRFRFDFYKTYSEIEISENIDGLESRVSQIFSPLLHLSTDEQTKGKFKNIARKINDDLRHSRAATIESHVLHAISILKNSTDTLSIGDIANLVFTEYGDYHERKITARWIGHIVSKKLGLKTYKKGGRIFLQGGQEKTLQGLYSKYSVSSSTSS